MHRTFAQHTDLSLDEIILTDPNEIHHLHKVLRKKEGDAIRIFNGEGMEADGRITHISKKDIQINILSRREIPHDSTITHLILACAIPKKEKFEWIIEKATELGVIEIFPIITQRTEFKFNPQHCRKKEERYQTVAINAAKQCQRLIIPKIHPIRRIRDLLDQTDHHTKIILPCLINNRQPIKEVFENAHHEKIMLMIGPEGDFTDQEITFALGRGAIPVSLGNTVLKVETAAISSVAFIKMFLM